MEPMDSSRKEPGAPVAARPAGAGPNGPGGPFDAATDATAVVASDGTVIGWTRGAETLLGRPAPDVVGRPAASLLAADGDPARVAGVVERCRAGMGWNGLVPLRHRDGRRIEADLRVSASFRLAGPARGRDGGQDGGRECFLVSAREQHREWTMGQSVLDGFLTRSPVGMAVLDLELRYVWLNDTLERFGGVPRRQRLGLRLSDLLPGLQAETIETLMRKVLATGQPVTDYEYLGWSWADPHRRHAYSSSFFPLVGADGTVTGICYMVLDVTERWNARRLLTLVNEAGTGIGTTLDVARTAQELADFAVPRFADIVVVDLLEHVLDTDAQGGRPDGAPPASARPVLRRAATSCAHGDLPEGFARSGERADPLPPPYGADLLTGGGPVLLPVLGPDDGPWAARGPDSAASAPHSLISVPMRARDTALGITTFLRSGNAVSFGPDDVLVAQELVARAALCVDNARRYSREHTAAVTLQQSLLPQALAGGTALEVASSYLPADATDGVGGDWFDVIPLSGARVGLVVGDVVGHGITAAAAMGRLRTAVQTLADMELFPDDLLAHLDDLVLRLSEAETGVEEARQSTAGFLGATCLYAVYDPVTRRCAMARAGHPPPVVVTPDGQVSFPEPPAGPPLGLGGMAFECAEIELPENSLLGLYTDGLIEGPDGDIGPGMARLGELLSRPAADLEGLCSGAVRELVPPARSDDVALLLTRTHALGADCVASWDVPVDPAAVSGLRALATRRLTEWGLHDLVMTTELIVSELVTNAMRHAAPPIRLRLVRGSRLTCEVFDSSSAAPRLRHARSTDEGGRGLFLVAQLTRRWGARHTGGGKIIWAEQELG
jgi:serine phosphatase RsbU (regulator of sigma subunit)/PAS domain-containing protein